MRHRPFLPAGEQPRPFSEVLAERHPTDQVERVFRDIAELEDQALAATDPAVRKRLQCDAEALRCAITESRRHR